MNPLRRTLARRSPVLLLTVCALLQLAGCKRKAVSEATAQRGTVLRLVGQGTDATNAAGLTGVTLEICDPHGAACTTASVGTPVPAGSVLRVGARGSAQVGLADGSAIALDHDSELFLAGNGTRRARLSHGSIVIDIPGKGATHARFDVNDGSVDLASGKMALRAGSDFAIVDVVRGKATLSSGTDQLSLSGGEEAR